MHSWMLNEEDSLPRMNEMHGVVQDGARVAVTRSVHKGYKYVLSFSTSF